MKIFFHNAKKYLMRKIFWEIFFHSQKFARANFFASGATWVGGKFHFQGKWKRKRRSSSSIFCECEKIVRVKTKNNYFARKKNWVVKVGETTFTTRAVCVRQFSIFKIVESGNTKCWRLVSRVAIRNVTRSWESGRGGVGGLNQFRKRTKKKRFYWANSTCRPRRNVSRFDPPFGGVPKRAKKGQKRPFFAKCVFSCKLEISWIFTYPGL